ncbi:heavy metal RND efflux outer membrane protein, CzcC family [Ichthyobacterium seriolicida]|uniref:Heavy metal RND efflux outer membrane protein, CzcC family n=2 Tax=Ichthyobacterium seriolicida TaxID=242600 RepID=A0A1J1DW42_9FLAO|nr:heavy metal RND efflux outer membrane protein, CzcC family [Ichthyobacterium seriolicida]
MKEAAENNLDLKESFLEYQMALEKIPQVGSLPDPKVLFGYFVSPAHKPGSQQFKVSISQAFPWFGTLGTKENIATANAKAKYEQFLNKKNQIFFEVSKRYYKLYELHKKIKLTEENIRILNSYEKLALNKYETAQINMVDILKIQMTENEVKNDLSVLKDDFKILESYFNNVLNRDNKEEIKLPESINIPTYESSLQDENEDEHISGNPVLRFFDFEIESNRHKSDLASKNYFPNFGIGLDYIYVENDNTPKGGPDMLMPMISINIPIFYSKYQAKKKESKLGIELAKHKKQRLHNDLVISYREYKKDIKNAFRSIKLYETQLKKSNQALSILLDTYSVAEKNLEEVLNMKQVILKYEFMLIESNIKVLVQTAKEKFLKGSF